MKAWLLFTFLFLLAVIGVPAHADITGKARVIDGDTIEITRQRIRLYGIDAPESRQYCVADGAEYPCGVMATAWLVEQTMGREVRCVGNEKDRYDRLVARCYMGGTELSSSIVQAGWALAYRQYSTDYVDVENVARERGIGIWRGQFTSPWEWRTGKRLAGTTEKNSHSGRCLIKGNISRSGARIFHVPGGAYYSRTRIDLSRGERWFCTEEEAIAAEWRRSKR